MLDINLIRENPDLVKDGIVKKNADPKLVDKFLRLDKDWRAQTKALNELESEQNKLTRELSEVRTEDLLSKAQILKKRLAEMQTEVTEIEKKRKEVLYAIPNIPLDDVPVGKTENENVVAKEVGRKPEFDFAPKNHWQIGEARGWIDKERATKVSGARFAYLKGDLVKLEWALMQFAMNILTNEDEIKNIISENNLKVSGKPFTPVLPPFLIRTEPYEAMDRLEPREERYKIEGEELWLEGSAEHVLGSMHVGETLTENEMPIRYVGFATSFRREAGSYGKDMEGIIRLHQFNKMEMESFSLSEQGLDEHLFMIAIQEYIMQRLELPYRVIMKCTADIGKPNVRGVDIDAWLPGHKKYLETHTADYMTDYQARRLNTRVRRKDGALELVHTNDATVLSERPLIAIIENNQEENGTVRVPKVLHSYLGKEVIG